MTTPRISAIAIPSSPLNQIESIAKALSDTRNVLSARVTALQEEMAAAQKRHLLGIKKSVALCAGYHNDLVQLVESNPGAFEKPRTHIFHGIKVGFQKDKGSTEIDNPERTIQLIERLYHGNDEMLELLINTKKTPNKKAIGDLPVSDAKRIGCEIIASGDAIVVRPVDDAVEKTVNALLKEAVEETAEKS